MKIEFYCENGANYHSQRSEIFDLETDLGMTIEEWEALSEEEKYSMVYEWMIDRLEYGFREV